MRYKLSTVCNHDLEEFEHVIVEADSVELAIAKGLDDHAPYLNDAEKVKPANHVTIYMWEDYTVTVVEELVVRNQ